MTGHHHSVTPSLDAPLGKEVTFVNENEKNENDVKEYEAPEVFELGPADELTHGRCGDWPDALNRWIFTP